MNANLASIIPLNANKVNALTDRTYRVIWLDDVFYKQTLMFIGANQSLWMYPRLAIVKPCN